MSLIETETDWVLTGFSHPNYLAEFGASGQSEVYANSSLDLAMKVGQNPPHLRMPQNAADGE